jgi:hypothetical protein
MGAPGPQVLDEDTMTMVYAASIAAPSAPGAGYVQAEATAAVTAINAILAALRAAGIIAQD